MSTRKEKLIEELITRHAGDAIMILSTGAGKTSIRKSLEDYDTDELRRKLDMIDEKPQVDTMTPAEINMVFARARESDEAMLQLYGPEIKPSASTEFRRANPEFDGDYLPALPGGETLYTKWQEECQKRLAEVMGLPRNYMLDGDITTGASTEPDDNTMAFDELRDYMVNVRGMFMAGDASLPHRTGGYLPPSDELPTVDWTACRHANPLYVQMLGRALRPHQGNYTWRMTRGKQPRKIKVWHKSKQRTITIDYDGEVVE